MTFTNSLLPVIRRSAVLLNQSTLEKAIESALKAEMSVREEVQ